MLRNDNRWFVIFVILGVLFITNIPYIYAFIGSGEEYIFGGFLLNPLDGNSYLAKMYQGWRGDTLFTLPFTEEFGRGAFLFVLYLGLGHFARLLGVQLIIAFHGARFLATIGMLLSLYTFLVSILGVGNHLRIAYFLTAFGSGLGWLFVAFGLFTSDFWVAEAYPYLSAYVNPHFPLSVTLMLWIFVQFERKTTPPYDRKFSPSDWIIGIIALLLGVISPFGVVLVIAILTLLIIWEIFPDYKQLLRSKKLRILSWIVICTAPMLSYQLWITNTDPLLSVWNEQNQTPSPYWWDFLISLSLPLVFSIYGVMTVVKGKIKYGRLVTVWMVLGILFVYFPWSLQRRFMMGLYIPLVALAILWISSRIHLARLYRWLISFVLVMAIPTNVLIFLSAFHGINTHDPYLYLFKEEKRAFDWIELNTQPRALILAAPATGLLLPAHTGRRVIYGHPFETVHANDKEFLVKRYFQGDPSLVDLPSTRSVDYIFYGPREQELEVIPLDLDFPVAYQDREITIYHLGN